MQIILGISYTNSPPPLHFNVFKIPQSKINEWKAFTVKSCIFKSKNLLCPYQVFCNILCTATKYLLMFVYLSKFLSFASMNVVILVVFKYPSFAGGDSTGELNRIGSASSKRLADRKIAIDILIKKDDNIHK